MFQTYFTLWVGVWGRRRVPSGCGHEAAPNPPPLALSREGVFRVIAMGVKHCGGGAPSAMMGVAKQPSAGELYAPPPRIIAMAADGVNLSARSQPAPGHRAGVVEPGHRVGPELWAYHCRRPTGLPA